MRYNLFLLTFLVAGLTAATAEAKTKTAKKASVPATTENTDTLPSLDLLRTRPTQLAPAPAIQPASAAMVSAPSTTTFSAPPRVVAAPAAAPAAMSAPTMATAPAMPAPAGAPGPAAPFKTHGFVEAGANFHNLSKNYDNWSGEYIKGEIQTDPKNRWNALLLNQREFGETGNYGAIGNTHDWNEDWYTSLSAGASTSGFFLPRYRVDGFVNRKWLPSRQLITTAGLGYYKARDNHKDYSAFLGATYYFVDPWIVQGGVRFNISDPGSVNSTSQFVAVTQGRDQEHFLTLRYGFGKEAYQITGPGAVLSDFNSQTVSLEWRQWWGKDWGTNLLGEQYFSKNYDRSGITLGVFGEF